MTALLWRMLAVTMSKLDGVSVVSIIHEANSLMDGDANEYLLDLKRDVEEAR